VPAIEPTVVRGIKPIIDYYVERELERRAAAATTKRARTQARLAPPALIAAAPPGVALDAARLAYSRVQRKLPYSGVEKDDLRYTVWKAWPFFAGGVLAFAPRDEDTGRFDADAVFAALEREDDENVRAFLAWRYRIDATEVQRGARGGPAAVEEVRAVLTFAAQLIAERPTRVRWTTSAEVGSAFRLVVLYAPQPADDVLPLIAHVERLAKTEPPPKQDVGEYSRPGYVSRAVLNLAGNVLRDADALLVLVQAFKRVSRENEARSPEPLEIQTRWAIGAAAATAAFDEFDWVGRDANELDDMLFGALVLADASTNVTAFVAHVFAAVIEYATSANAIDTTLKLALENNHLQVVQYLFTQPGVLERVSGTLLEHVASADAVALLAAAGAFVDADERVYRALRKRIETTVSWRVNNDKHALAAGTVLAALRAVPYPLESDARIVALSRSAGRSSLSVVVEVETYVAERGNKLDYYYLATMAARSNNIEIAKYAYEQDYHDVMYSENSWVSRYGDYRVSIVDAAFDARDDKADAASVRRRRDIAVFFARRAPPVSINKVAARVFRDGADSNARVSAVLATDVFTGVPLSESAAERMLAALLTERVPLVEPPDELRRRALAIANAGGVSLRTLLPDAALVLAVASGRLLVADVVGDVARTRSRRDFVARVADVRRVLDALAVANAPLNLLHEDVELVSYQGDRGAPTPLLARRGEPLPIGTASMFVDHLVTERSLPSALIVYTPAKGGRDVLWSGTSDEFGEEVRALLAPAHVRAAFALWRVVGFGSINTTSILLTRAEQEAAFPNAQWRERVIDAVYSSDALRHATSEEKAIKLHPFINVQSLLTALRNRSPFAGRLSVSLATRLVRLMHGAIVFERPGPGDRFLIEIGGYLGQVALDWVAHQRLTGFASLLGGHVRRFFASDEALVASVPQFAGALRRRIIEREFARPTSFRLRATFNAFGGISNNSLELPDDVLHQLDKLTDARTFPPVPQVFELRSAHTGVVTHVGTWEFDQKQRAAAAYDCSVPFRIAARLGLDLQMTPATRIVDVTHVELPYATSVTLVPSDASRVVTPTLARNVRFLLAIRAALWARVAATLGDDVTLAFSGLVYDLRVAVVAPARVKAVLTQHVDFDVVVDAKRAAPPSSRAPLTAPAFALTNYAAGSAEPPRTAVRLAGWYTEPRDERPHDVLLLDSTDAGVLALVGETPCQLCLEALNGPPGNDALERSLNARAADAPPLAAIVRHAPADGVDEYPPPERYYLRGDERQRAAEAACEPSADGEPRFEVTHLACLLDRLVFTTANRTQNVVSGVYSPARVRSVDVCTQRFENVIFAYDAMPVDWLLSVLAYRAEQPYEPDDDFDDARPFLRRFMATLNDVRASNESPHLRTWAGRALHTLRVEIRGSSYTDLRLQVLQQRLQPLMPMM